MAVIHTFVFPGGDQLSRARSGSSHTSFAEIPSEVEGPGRLDIAAKQAKWSFLVVQHSQDKRRQVFCTPAWFALERGPDTN